MSNTMLSDDDVDLTNSFAASVKDFLKTCPDVDCSDGLSFRCDAMTSK